MRKTSFVILVLAAVSGGLYFHQARTAASEPVVTTQPFSRGDVIDAVSATGTLEAVDTVDIGTQVSGVVRELNADFNSIVRKGQIIARLDPQLIETQIEQQRANVVRAEAELDRLEVSLLDARQKLDRAKQLDAKNLIPRTELDTAALNVRTAEAQIKSAEASVAQARAQLNNQRVNLAYTTIKAPIDGIVISRNVDEGQTVAASMNAPTLFVLAADLTKMQVVASIDEADVGRMRPGQPVTFTVDAYPGERFTGAVAQVRLQPAVVQNVVTYSTVISVPNAQLKLKPGMTANVSIEVIRRDDVVRVANAGLRFRPTAEMFAVLNQPVPAGVATGAGAAARPARAENTSTPGSGAQRAAATSGAARLLPATASGAATIDALFAPVATIETRGVVWQYEGNQLKRLHLRLGATDGTFTEVLNDMEVPAGAAVVTAMQTGLQPAKTTSAVGNPLLGPQRAPARGSAR